VAGHRNFFGTQKLTVTKYFQNYFCWYATLQKKPANLQKSCKNIENHNKIKYLALAGFCVSPEKSCKSPKKLQMPRKNLQLANANILTIWLNLPYTLATLCKKSCKYYKIMQTKNALTLKIINLHT